MYKTKANFHIHTLASDGLFSVKKIMKAAQKRGVKVISITDHNVIKNSLKAYRLAEEFDLIVIPGVEFLFRVGEKYYEVLAYFETASDLKRFWRSIMRTEDFVPIYGNPIEPIERIKKFGGVVVAPHLFSYKGFFRDGEKAAVHGIEEINSHKGKKQTQLSKELAQNGDYLGFGGGDVHIYRFSLDGTFTMLESEEPITHASVWRNLSRKDNSINFIPSGKYLPLHLRYFQSLACLFLVIFFLLRQAVPLFRRRLEYYRSL